MRRELLVGSIVEERNVGHFLSEKQAGIFYFPHTSFMAFLVADYLLSPDFVVTDMKKVSGAMHSEVPTFLKEHSPASILDVYKRGTGFGYSAGVTGLLSAGIVKQFQ